ncbi:cyclopropane-fatty-acyl-phospholipid synthase [Janthinobacterium sp. 35]|uniref:SAM-dependent methyltransferase n=1 Tax=unclassified Janthinobacterium TaxID=2610881 RepID=UPI000C368FA4|nr:MULTISPECIES: cyclopropane-fatty-acyl-phospholipid synthase family protein [unclassified Janthinobacterium]PIG27289.1 cyclopropane-fatty-acyl-phospholipid synthase [Janthinobacterium sp. 35]PVX34585.1 cyclopropane-fatty-acyl-phospholipid synthase [Janthinobacterium sp. 78]
MSSDSLPTGLHARSGPSPTHVHEHLDLPAAARMILRLLEKLQYGALRLRTPDGRILLYGDASHPVTLDLHNWHLCSAVLRSGDIGFAETFIAGDWRTDNLPGLIELMIRNRAQIESLIYGNWWGSLLYKVRHLLNRNSRAGSKKNIHAHYDIGNAFYQLWLDPSMTYSSALFSEGASLEQAQGAKYRRIASQLQLQPGQRVLEIGCGWGGFAETAARDNGAHVTGLTLSTEQLAYARQRLQDAGLAGQADLQLCDYRDSAGQYDAIASIEMFEAVGQRYWPGYFACVARNLKPGGRACIQTIVIADALFQRYSKSTDFIQQYIFPGGMLPSPLEFRRAAEAQGLRVEDAFSFGLDYAETLRQWRASFLAQRTALEKQGFDGRFLLTWEFYLAYCEAAFQAHNTDVMQFTLIKD